MEHVSVFFAGANICIGPAGFLGCPAAQQTSRERCQHVLERTAMQSPVMKWCVWFCHISLIT